MSLSAAETRAAELLKEKLGKYPDFPKPGIIFFDIFTLFRDPVATEQLITTFLNHIFSYTIPTLLEDGQKIDMIVGLDARGFLFGPLLAARLCAGFVPVRKQGKLPGKCHQASYAKEYGSDVFEMQEDALQSGQNVLIVDDLIATGGSAAGACQLVKQSGAIVVENLFCIEIPALKGKDKLTAPSWSIIQTD